MRRLLAVTLLLICHATLTATVLVPIEFRELVGVSSLIVRGRVTGVHADWIDGRRAIETQLTIDVEEYLKGRLGETLVVRVPGGQIGRYRTVFVGAPEFHEGDAVVLFLRGAGGRLSIVGLSQGAFRLRTDAAGHAVVASPVLMGNPAVDREAVVRGASTRRPLGLDAFRDLVKRVLAGDAK